MTAIATDKFGEARATAGAALDGNFNLFLSGNGVATIQLERSPDKGANWFPIYANGVQLFVWTYNGSNISETLFEPEAGMQYRLNCTSYTSGTVNTRFSR